MRMNWSACLAPALCAACSGSQQTPVEGDAAESARFLPNVHQLALGRQDAEAYWSPEGSRLVS